MNENEFYENIKEKNKVIAALIELLCIAEFKNRGLSLKENEEMLEDLQDYLWHTSSSWLCTEDESCYYFNISGCDDNHCEAMIESFINKRIDNSEENDELLIYIDDELLTYIEEPATIDEANLEILASAFNPQLTVQLSILN